MCKPDTPQPQKKFALSRTLHLTLLANPMTLLHHGATRALSALRTDFFRKMLMPGKAEVSCATLLKTLGDDTRLRVVRQLMAGPKNVGAINRRLALDQSLLSHHLKVLRSAGIVTSSRAGKTVVYSLAPSVEERRIGNAINLGCCKISFE